MATPDYSTWLTKDAAAAALGVSTKTIEAFAKDRKIDQAAWRPQGRGAARAVYNPDDVARLAAERQPAATAFVLPAVTTAAAGNGTGRVKSLTETPGSFLQTLPADDDPLRQLFAAALRAVLASPSAETSQSSQKSAETLYVTVKDAAAILGLPQADVRRLIDDGDLDCRRTGRGGIRIRRRDLEAL